MPDVSIKLSKLSSISCFVLPVIGVQLVRSANKLPIFALNGLFVAVLVKLLTTSAVPSASSAVRAAAAVDAPVPPFAMPNSPVTPGRGLAFNILSDALEAKLTSTFGA